MVWASGRTIYHFIAKEKNLASNFFQNKKKMFNIFSVWPDKLNGCRPSLILVKESYSLQNFHSFDRSHCMLLSKNDKVHFFVTSFLVVILAILLSYVERKFDIFIFE